MEGNTKFSRHLLAIACGVAVSLVGCGGSSSSSSNTGSTDGNNSESSNGTVTLTGKVVDEVIPFAEVCLYQGNTELECVTADANANYALTLSRPTGDQPLRLVASKEVTGKGIIKLSSSLGLAKDIPADTEISQSKLPALAVTNISTALDVMALDANGLVDINRLQQIRADEKLSDAATALGTSIKDYVDSILDGSFTLEGRDTLEVAQLAKAVVQDGSLSAANLAALIELARSSSAKSAKTGNGSENRPAAKGDGLKDSEAYELSTRPQLVSAQYIKATAPYELMSFDANGDLQWCKTSGCSVQPYELEWNNTDKNWVIKAGTSSVAVVDGIPDGYQMSRSLVKDQYDGWYFVELKGTEPSVSYQSHFFNTNGGYQFRNDALNKEYKKSDGWTWTAFKTLAELEAETPTVQETWSISGRALVVGTDKYYRISDGESDGEKGQWRFLKQSGNNLDLVRMLPMMSTSPNAPSFFAEIEQLASADTGYSFLSFYEVEDYFGWANYYKANGKVNGCTTWLGDQESFAIYCVDEVSGDDRVRNLVKIDILDRNPAESFNYYFSGDLISSSFSFEEKVHCGASATCDMASEGAYHEPVKTARVLQPRIRTFDWSESVLAALSGKTIAFQVRNGTGVSTVEITFNSNISSAQSDLLASIKIDGTALGIQESILSSGVNVRNEDNVSVNPKPAQLARGFIHVNLNGLADVVGENINALQLFLHSQEVASDAKNIGISMVRVAIDAGTKETSFYPLPSSVNISASIH